MRGPSSGFAALADCDPEALLEEEETRASAQAGSRITDTSKAASRGNNSSPSSCGRTPNIYWCALTPEELRVHPRYDALPAVSEVTIDGTESYRRVRQDSKEWAELHAGVLTTGLLSDALGLREKAAGKRLGTSKGELGHHRLLAAFRHLRRGVADAPEPVGGPALHRPSSKSARRKGKRTHVTGGDRMPTWESCVAASGESWLSTSTALAEQGVGQVRCGWGNAQEPSTVYSLLHHFGESMVEEVGLCMLTPEGLRQQLGDRTPTGSLPPLGASPDGNLLSSTMRSCRPLAFLDSALPSFIV
ncbi:hypothetical protein CYMTET_30827 [Cymbomonas tetramitiformis]|uniref:Uncharacterized protein n=1 Tax=Cymbomonas tetramitiformis TaxID=36881 RepID=A0AAE0FIC1_9CHLO|nr:hypothetical protein CYMTET_30827 [Cymbomonas tetramitiformis]